MPRCICLDRVLFEGVLLVAGHVPVWRECQRDWNREATVPGFAEILFAIESR
jgi:hypothetical protein